MIISWKWLQNLVETNGISATEAAAKLTARGLEVEGYTPDPTCFGDIKVAKIIHIAEHPNSDHLHLCDVDAGTVIGQSADAFTEVEEHSKIYLKVSSGPLE